MMSKMIKRTIVATKNCGRTFSTMASSSSSVKHGLGNPNGVALCVAFLAGFLGHVWINTSKRHEHWEKVNKMYVENMKHSEAMYARFLSHRMAMFQAKAMKGVVRESSS